MSPSPCPRQTLGKVPLFLLKHVPWGGLVVRVAMRDVVGDRWLQGGSAEGELYLRGDLIGEVA